MSPDIYTDTKQDQDENLHLLHYLSLDPATIRVRDMLLPGNKFLSSKIGNTFNGLPQEFLAFRAVLRDPSTLPELLSKLREIGRDYQSANGVIMSPADIDVCAAFLVPDKVREVVRENIHLLIQNVPLAELGNDYFREKTGLILVYDNTDHGFIPVRGYAHRYTCKDENFKSRLQGFIQVDFV